MKEPRRLLDAPDTSPEARELLRHGRAPDRLDPAAFRRSKRRLLASAAVPAAAGTFLWVQHAALGALLGVAVTVTATLVPRAFAPEAAPSAREAKATNAPVAPAPRVSPAPEPASEPLNPTPTPPRTEPAPAPAPTPFASADAPIESSAERLAREAKLLERARTLLARSPGEALAVLTDHERTFADGALGPEREILAVDALVRLGRRDEAERRGRALTARSPGSLYEERLRRILSPNSAP